MSRRSFCLKEKIVTRIVDLRLQNLDKRHCISPGLAEQFASYARTVRGRWPRTAAMLDRMANSYRAEARREDQQDELREDLGF